MAKGSSEARAYRSFRFETPAYRAFSPARIGAMVTRYWYLLRGSWPRLVDIVYWPTVQMVMWGLLQTYLKDVTSGTGVIAGALIGGVLLWDVLLRGQFGFSISFLEEMWSRNLGHLLMSPLRPAEFVASLACMSAIRAAIGLVPVTGLAILFFGFNLWHLGFGLALFFANLLLTAWAIGLFVCGLLLRNGLGAEGIAWSLIFLLLPLCCVYYPVSTMPEWLQWIALALPPTHVFEGMRSILLDNTLDMGRMALAFGLNCLYLAAGATAFVRLFDAARRAGSLIQQGE